LKEKGLRLRKWGFRNERENSYFVGGEKRRNFVKMKNAEEGLLDWWFS